MYKIKPATLAFGAFALAANISPATALQFEGGSLGAFMPISTAMAEGGVTSAPLGHIALCMKNRADCEVRNVSAASGEADDYFDLVPYLPIDWATGFETGQSYWPEPQYGPVELTPQTWTQLIRVNGRFNAKIRSVTDWARTGKLDVWSVSGNAGDCEDYALQKRKELIHLGWPSHSTLIAIVVDPRFGSHAVLVARTSKGDFVLDNLRKTVMAWHETPYRWVKRQSTADPRKWVRLSGGSIQVASYGLDVPLPALPRLEEPTMLDVKPGTSDEQRAVSAPRPAPRIQIAKQPANVSAGRLRMAMLGRSAKRHALDRDMTGVWRARTSYSNGHDENRSTVRSLPKPRKARRRVTSGSAWFHH